LVFKDRAGYDTKRKMVTETTELLKRMGYGPNLKVDYK
jgi:hypothetical protein